MKVASGNSVGRSRPDSRTQGCSTGVIRLAFSMFSAPRDLKKGAAFIQGSILDRPKLTEIFRGYDCIVHIAAWHGGGRSPEFVGDRHYLLRWCPVTHEPHVEIEGRDEF